MHSGIPKCLLCSRPEPTKMALLHVGYREQRRGVGSRVAQSPSLSGTAPLPLLGLSCLRGLETRGLEPTACEVHPGSKTLQSMCLLGEYSQGAKHQETETRTEEQDKQDTSVWKVS